MISNCDSRSSRRNPNTTAPFARKSAAGEHLCHESRSNLLFTMPSLDETNPFPTMSQNYERGLTLLRLAAEQVSTMRILKSNNLVSMSIFRYFLVSAETFAQLYRSASPIPAPPISSPNATWDPSRPCSIAQSARRMTETSRAEMLRSTKRSALSRSPTLRGTMRYSDESHQLLLGSDMKRWVSRKQSPVNRPPLTPLQAGAVCCRLEVSDHTAKIPAGGMLALTRCSPSPSGGCFTLPWADQHR